MIAINLLDWRLKYVNIQNTRFYVITGAVVAVCFLITLSTVLIVNKLEATVKEDIAYLNTEIITVEGKIKDIKNLQDQKSLLLSRRQVIESLQSNRSLAVTIFNDLIRAIPDNVVLNTLSRKGVELDLDGNSDSNYSITVFVDNMQKLPWVESAKLTQIKTSRTESTDSSPSSGSINFQMKVTINADT